MLDYENAMKNAGYTLMCKLGAGLYANSYLCEHKYYGMVVLKEYNLKTFLKNRWKNHYEVTILSTLYHRSIPKVFGMLRIKKRVYLVLEYLQGNTLNAWLFKKYRRFNDFEIIEIYTQLISIVEYIHSRNIAHRDISIDNILYDGKNIYLIDFGLARSVRYEADARQRDYYCLGEILLFMLYSRYDKQHYKDGILLPWYKELKLTKRQKKHIARLLGLDCKYQCIGDILKDFTSFF